jgi:hypothetical protein
MKAVSQFELSVTEWPARHCLSALLVRREWNEVACVPRWLRADDGYLRRPIEVSLDRSNRELKLETLVRPRDVKVDKSNTSHPLVAVPRYHRLHGSMTMPEV